MTQDGCVKLYPQTRIAEGLLFVISISGVRKQEECSKSQFLGSVVGCEKVDPLTALYFTSFADSKY